MKSSTLFWRAMAWLTCVAAIASAATTTSTTSSSAQPSATGNGSYALSLGGPTSNMTAACATVFNTLIQGCPWWLLKVSTTNLRLRQDQLTALCTSTCLSSLNSIRQNVVSSCTSSNDSIPWGSHVWPPTIVPDRYLYTYNQSCRTDSASGQFCDTIFTSWLNQSSLSSAQNCSDCNLGLQQIQLNSPFGYEDDFASSFQALTTSCNATGKYPWTSPTPYPTVSSNATATTTSTAANATVTQYCAQNYTVQSGDSCDKIALAFNVSTFSVIQAGNLDQKCLSLQVGQSLCLPQSCALYRVQNGDTGTSIIGGLSANVTVAQFLSWNPNINAYGNVRYIAGTLICVGPPGGGYAGAVPTTPLAVSTATTPTAVPTNAVNGSNTRCGQWYNVSAGDYCDKVSVNQGISLKDFYFLNPEINANCSNLLLGYSYCVQAVGNIQTYSGYPTTTQFYSLTPLNFSTTTATTYATGSSVISTPSSLPTASGSLANCSTYVNYRVPQGINDQSYQSYYYPPTPYMNDCGYLTSLWMINLNSFLSWNPSLANMTSCNLQPGYSYCMVRNASDIGVEPAPSHCLPATNITSGTTASCTCFTEIRGDDKGYYGCSDIASDYNITVSQIQQWNSWIGSNCDTGLYANITSNSTTRFVCVAANSSAPTTPVSGSNSPTGTGTASMGPTPSGTTSGCTQYYTVKTNDTCQGVLNAYGITFNQFYGWNPSVGNNCQNLQPGYAYCVNGPTSTSSGSASSTTPTPAPTRSGTAANCTTYYTVMQNDSCQNIENLYNITFQTLYKWNTNIGDNCQSLWPGYGVCVAGGPN